MIFDFSGKFLTSTLQRPCTCPRGLYLAGQALCHRRTALVAVPAAAPSPSVIQCHATDQSKHSYPSIEDSLIKPLPRCSVAPRLRLWVGHGWGGGHLCEVRKDV